jgi:hypothetical protein
MLNAIPPSGAGAVKVTDAVEVAPPTTVVGLRVNEARLGSGGTRVTVTPYETPP